MDSPPIPKAFHEFKIAMAWQGRPRKCPECKYVFVSQHDRGQCTNCRHVFEASDLYGAPPDADLDVILQQIIDEQAQKIELVSDLIMDVLEEPIDQIPAREFRGPDAEWHAERWEFECYYLRKAVEKGGVLWKWSAGPASGSSRLGVQGSR